MKGLEVPFNQYRVSNGAIGTKELCDCCGVGFGNELVGGLAHVYPTGFQPERNLSNLLEELLKKHRRESLQADVIGGYDRDYEMILEFLTSQKIKIRTKVCFGISRKNLIYIPQTKELILYSGCFSEGHRLSF